MGYLYVRMIGDARAQLIRFRTLRDARHAAALLNQSTTSNIVYAYAIRGA
jgi:hypothetical protein